MSEKKTTENKEWYEEIKTYEKICSLCNGLDNIVRCKI